MILNHKELNEMIDKGYIAVRKHPEEDYYIYNYTHSAQYDRVWNNTTITCRGLVLDKKSNIIARPFRKFFNYGEKNVPSHVPNDNFEIYEKLDGILGILYWVKDRPFIATRGSFDSKYAIEANKMLNENKDIWKYFDKNLTYLFEIIYPEGRIIVDYGNERKLVLLGAIEKNTGKDINISNIDCPLEKAKKIKRKPINELLNENEKNKEGYVLRWEDGHRIKIKLREYKRLTSILIGLNTKKIWEYIAIENVYKNVKTAKDLGLYLKLDEKEIENLLALHGNNIFDSIYGTIPDEFYDIVKNYKNDYIKEYKYYDDKVKKILSIVKEKYDLSNRRDIFKFLKENYDEYSPIIMAILSNKPYEHLIWRLVKPDVAKPIFGT